MPTGAVYVYCAPDHEILHDRGIDYVYVLDCELVFYDHTVVHDCELAIRGLVIYAGAGKLGQYVLAEPGHVFIGSSLYDCAEIQLSQSTHHTFGHGLIYLLFDLGQPGLICGKILHG